MNSSMIPPSCCCCALAVLVALLPSTPASAHRIGILPVDGAKELTGRLDPELKERLLRLELKIQFDAPDLSGRLGEAHSAVRGLAAAKNLIDKSRRSGTYMKREEAVDQARRAIRLLEKHQARFCRPAPVVQAYIALGMGLLLRPVDERGAVKAFRRAIEADPDWKVDAERFHPRAAALFHRARRGWRAPRMPAPGVLGAVARRLKLTHLVWLAVRLEGGAVRLRGAVVNRGGEILVRIEDQSIPEALLEKRVTWKTAAALRRMILHLATNEPLHLALGPSSGRHGTHAGGDQPGGRDLLSPPDGDLRVSSRPFYKKWWFWTAVGVAATGIVVGGVAASQGGSERLPHGEAGQMTLGD